MYARMVIVFFKSILLKKSDWINNKTYFCTLRTKHGCISTVFYYSQDNLCIFYTIKNPVIIKQNLKSIKLTLKQRSVGVCVYFVRMKAFY